MRTPQRPSQPNAQPPVSILTAALLIAAIAWAAKPVPAAEERPRKRVLLIVGENFEELEFAAYTGVLSWTRAYSFKGTPIDVVVAGFTPQIRGMGSMRIVPDVLVKDLKTSDIDRFDAVAIPCSVGSGRGQRTYRGQTDLLSSPVLKIVRRVHGRGGTIATMCCSKQTAIQSGVLKKDAGQCQYWNTKKRTDGSKKPAPLAVSNRVITTMGPAVASEAVVLLIELLNGPEEARDFVRTCPWVFGARQEFGPTAPVDRP